MLKHLIKYKKSNMKNKKFQISLFLILCIGSTITLLAQSVLNVPSSFKDIQSALDAANKGDIILVQPGHYYENLNWPQKNGIKLISAGTAQNTIIDGNGIDRVIKISNDFGPIIIDTTTLIQGFTITNGHINEPGQWAYGAGIYLEGVSPHLKDLVINKNFSTGTWCFGAGIYMEESRPIIENTEVSENILRSSSWSYGAGIYSTNSSPIIKNAFISKNKMESGAIWYFGAGIYINDSHVQLNNSIISNNEMIGSTGSWYFGGGIYCSTNSSRSSIKVINCTIANNFHSNGNELEGGGICIDESDGTVLNSIIWNNGNSELVEENFSGTATLEVSYSDIKGGWKGIGNIDKDPLFINNESYFLKLESPCLGVGTLIHAPQNDIFGNPRPSPVRSNPDMGAIEMDQDFAHVLAVVYYDENKNGRFDSWEHLQQNGSVLVSPSNYNLLYNNGSGILALLKTGKYRIEFNPLSLPKWQLTSGESSFDIDVNFKNFADTIYFGVAPDILSSELVTNIYSPPLRCNETIKFSVFLKNEGSQIENGTLWFKIDERLTNLNFLDKPDTMINPNIYGWYYTNLYPSEGLMKCIKIKIPGVNDIPAGELLHFKSYVEEAINSLPLTSNMYCYDVPIRCSFDPNDKMVNPMRAENYTLFNEDLIYTIRFQNTGNDLAYRVVISDTLDPKLDWSSLQVLNSSHQEHLATDVSENGIITFSFENIRLPFEKQDKEGSNGFVSYKIKSIANVPEKSSIQNTAYIYFDYNPPIRTNTTQSIMVEKLPTSNSQTDKDIIGIYLYPNPAANYVYMKSILNKPISYILYSNDGNEIKKGEFLNNYKLNLESIKAGTYFLKFKCSNHTECSKLIILK